MILLDKLNTEQVPSLWTVKGLEYYLWLRSPGVVGTREGGEGGIQGMGPDGKGGG